MAAFTRALSVVFLVLPPVLSSVAAGASAEESARDVYSDGVRAFERGDRATALDLWMPLAERGDPRAQFGLGLIYEARRGDQQADREEALRWYRQAARRGLPPAQNNLALMYAEGRAVPRDPALAVTLWREAAEAGYGPAQFNLAVALESGFGVGRNEREAELWYERAREQGVDHQTPGRFVEREREPDPRASPPSGAHPPAKALAAEGARGRVEMERQPEPTASVSSEVRARAPAPAPAAPLSARSASAPTRAMSGASAFYVQLAALRSHPEAVSLGRELASRHADLLTELEPRVRTVDLGSKGVWHRILFGPLASREDATGICGAIRARAGDCLVAAYPVQE